MVLRSDRRTAPLSEERAAIAMATGFTAGDVGRQLSRERTRQGLSLQDVGMRTGIPVDQLRSAETGVLDRPDGLATLKTVRRYADFLGLPGDRFALAILERWPTKGGPRPFGPDRFATAEVAAGGNGHGPSNGDRKAGGAPAPNGATDQTKAQAKGQKTSHPRPGARPEGHARAGRDDDTRMYDPVGPIEWLTPSGNAATHGGAYSDTGVTPAVLAPADQVWRRPRRRAPVALQALIVIVTIAVLAGVALLVIDRTRPSWLRAVGLTHAAAPAAGAAAVHHASRADSPAAHTAPSGVLKAHKTSGGATFSVPASTFTAKLTAPSGPCWVEVSTNTSSTPAYAAVIDAGGSRTFSHVHGLVVQMGSTAGRLTITSSGGHVATYAPQGAPYRITVHTRR